MSRQRLLRVFAVLVSVFFVWGGLQTASGLWILSEIQKRAHVRVEGEYAPDFFSSSFRLKKAKLVYPDRFEAGSGQLKVRYNLLPLSPELLHVWVQGSGLKVRLLGRWTEVRGVQREAPLDRFEVELQLVRRGILLQAADIQSSVFQFQIKKSENFRGQFLN